MIEKIELNNFQCHEHLVLALDRITTLVGPSDSGKSAVMRALDWAVFNNGKTAQLIRRGSKVSSVTISVDGHTVTRTTKNNAYIVDGTELSAIGRSVPVDIPEIFRMGDDNIQRQHEYLFWFSATGSELTRNFNRVVDLSRLDEWVRIGIDTEKHHKQDVRYCDKRIEELTASEQSLEPYESLADELLVVSGAYDELLKWNETYNVVLNLCQELRTTEHICTRHSYFRDLLGNILTGYEDIEREKTLVSLYIDLAHCCEKLVLCRGAAVSLQTVLEGYDDYKRCYSYCCDVVGVLRAIRDGDNSLESLRVAASIEIPFQDLFSLREELSELATIVFSLSLVIPDTLPVYSALEEYRGTSNQLYEISTVVSALQIDSDLISSLHKQLEQSRQEFDILSEGLCPLCGQSMRGHNHG